MVKYMVFLLGITFLLVPQVVGAVDLINYSARSYVSSGEGVTVGGFIVASKPHKMLIRVKGPSLKGVISEPLGDPILAVYAGNDLTESNDNWKEGSKAQEILSSGFAPPDDREPAVVGIFYPGVYSCVVYSKANDKGVALLEIMDLGEEILVYDDFAEDTLNTDLWNIEGGSPIVDQGYFYCKSDQFDPGRNTYFCGIKSVEGYGRWGLSIVDLQESLDGQLVMEMCFGVIGTSSVCGRIEVSLNRKIYATVVKLSPQNVVEETLFNEELPALASGTFFSINWDYITKRVDFTSSNQHSSYFHTISKFLPELNEVFEKSPLRIYTYGGNPLESVYPVAYVEH